MDELDKLLARFEDQILADDGEALKKGELTYREQARQALTAYVDRQVVLGQIEELRRLKVDAFPNRLASLGGIYSLGLIQDRLSALQNQLKELDNV